MKQTNYRQFAENNWLSIFRKLEQVCWKFNIENYTEGKSKMEPLVVLYVGKSDFEGTHRWRKSHCFVIAYLLGFLETN